MPPATQVQAHDPGDDEGDGKKLESGYRFPEGENSDRRDQRGSEPRPDGIGHAHANRLERDGDGRDGELVAPEL